MNSSCWRGRWTRLRDRSGLRADYSEKSGLREYLDPLLYDNFETRMSGEELDPFGLAVEALLLEFGKVRPRFFEFGAQL